MFDASKIECAVFSNQTQNYLLPLASLAEVIEFKEMVCIEGTHIQWNGYKIPLYTFEFEKVKPKNTPYEKIAIVKAIFHKDSKAPPYFAIYFEGETYRKTLSSKSVKWIDQEKRQVQIMDAQSKLTASVFDLFAFSKRVEDSLIL